MPNDFLACESPLYFINQSKRRKVVAYIYDLSYEFNLTRDTAVRAMQYFDTFSVHTNKIYGNEWVRAETSLSRFKRAASLVLSKKIGDDCSSHVLSFLQRNALTPSKQTQHFKKALCLAETISVVCLVLASKFSERSSVSYRDALDILGHKMSLKEIIEFEQRVLKVLQWRLNTFTGYSFVEMLCKQIGLDLEDEFEARVHTNLHFIATHYELQSANPCVICGLAVLMSLADNPPDPPDEKYYLHLTLIARACGLDQRQKHDLDCMVGPALEFKRGQGPWSAG